MTDQRSMLVHEAIASALVQHGVDTLFGLVGDANLFMTNAYISQFGGRYIAANHESGAILMALGHATATGKTAAATVTHGTGLANTITGLIEGVKAQLPMVLVCGDTAVTDHRNMQAIAQRELVLATGAGFCQLRSPASTCEDLATAFRMAREQRRPVVFNMPVDFQWQMTTWRDCVQSSYAVPHAAPDGDAFDNALGILAAARAPLILAGRGAIAHKDALVALAERSGALLATTLKAKGLFADQAWSLGICGTLATDSGFELIAQSDCILSFGASLSPNTTGQGKLFDGKRVIQINEDSRDIGQFSIPDLGLVGDIGLTAEKIIYWLNEAEIPAAGFRGEGARALLDRPPRPARLYKDSRQGTVDLRHALTAIDGAIAPNRVLVTDGGRFVLEAWRSMSVAHAADYIHTLNFASIGIGMAEAIGAAAANPTRPTVLVMGDGGFMLGGITELHTAIRENLSLIVVICNDESYGAEHIQFRNKNMDPALSIFPWPDFAQVAQSFGAQAITVRSEADLQQAVTLSAQHRAGTLVINLMLDPDRMPEIPH